MSSDLMIFYDFFSGCGGTSQGMREAGLTVKLGIDFDRDSANTYRKNFPRARFIERDIRDLKTKDLESYVSRSTRRHPIVFGACAPCQPFSQQRRQDGLTDERKDLLGEFHRFVRFYLPEYIFLENVPGLQNVDERGGPFARFLKFLTKLGYSYAHKIVVSSHYGVPQHRRRLVLIASRFGPIEFPKPTHGPNSARKKLLLTVWGTIKHLPEIAAGEVHSSIPNHQAAKLSAMNLRRIKATRVGGGRADWPAALVLDCHRTHDGHTDAYGRMVKDMPSTALTTRCISLSNGRYGHPTQNRAISVREAACLQNFPMTFKFYGNQGSTARQIGNAVPVAIGRVFGRAIEKHYRAHLKAKRNQPA